MKTDDAKRYVARMTNAELAECLRGWWRGTTMTNLQEAASNEAARRLDLLAKIGPVQ